MNSEQVDHILGLLDDFEDFFKPLERPKQGEEFSSQSSAWPHLEVEKLIDTKDIMVKIGPLFILKNNYFATRDVKCLHE